MTTRLYVFCDYRGCDQRIQSGDMNVNWGQYQYELFSEKEGFRRVPFNLCPTHNSEIFHQLDFQKKDV